MDICVAVDAIGLAVDSVGVGVIVVAIGVAGVAFGRGLSGGLPFDSARIVSFGSPSVAAFRWASSSWWTWVSDGIRG